MYYRMVHFTRVHSTSDAPAFFLLPFNSGTHFVIQLDNPPSSVVKFELLDYHILMHTIRFTSHQRSDLPCARSKEYHLLVYASEPTQLYVRLARSRMYAASSVGN